nr:basic proline-rich protein [Macaca fascicularis]
MPSSHQDSASQKDPHSPPEASTGACVPQGPTAHGQVLWSGVPTLISSLQCWTSCLVGTTQSWEMPPPRRQKTDCSWQPQAQALVQGQQLVGSSLPAVPRIRPPAAACLEPEPGRAGKERRPRNGSAQLRPGQWLPCKVGLCTLQPLGPPGKSFASGGTWTASGLPTLGICPSPPPGIGLLRTLGTRAAWAQGRLSVQAGAERTRPPHPPNAVLLLQPKPSWRRAQGLPAAASSSGVAPRLQESHTPPRQLGPTADFGSRSSAARALTPHPAPAPPPAGPSPGSLGPSSPAAPPTARGADGSKAAPAKTVPATQRWVRRVRRVRRVRPAPRARQAGRTRSQSPAADGSLRLRLRPPPPRRGPSGGGRRTLSGAGATVNPSPPGARRSRNPALRPPGDPLVRPSDPAGPTGRPLPASSPPPRAGPRRRVWRGLRDEGAQSGNSRSYEALWPGGGSACNPNNLGD